MCGGRGFCKAWQKKGRWKMILPSVSFKVKSSQHHSFHHCRDFSGLALLLGDCRAPLPWPWWRPPLPPRRHPAATTQRSPTRWSWSALPSSVLADPPGCRWDGGDSSGHTDWGTQHEFLNSHYHPFQLTSCPPSLSPGLWNRIRCTTGDQDTAQKSRDVLRLWHEVIKM